MVDLTIINPTDNSFPIGTNLSCPVEVGVIFVGNPSIGSGTLSTFTSSAAQAQGSYSIDVFVSGSGTWDVSAVEQSDGTWSVDVQLTGTFASHSAAFTANASTSGNSVIFANVNNPSETITLAQDNGGLFTKGKITISLSSASQHTLYLYNNS